jgi:uncharacterized protein (TIGR02145 family)
MKTGYGVCFVIFTFLFAGCNDDPIINAKDGTFTDPRDQHEYGYVKIGTQSWMADNLAYLPSVSPASSSSLKTPLYYVIGCELNSVAEAKMTENYKTYGALYNWTAAMTACPTGWHLPTIAEWDTLNNFLADEQGRKLKSTTGWTYELNGDNSSGFNALPGGYVSTLGHLGLGFVTYFWSADKDNESYPLGRYLMDNNKGLEGVNNTGSSGYSIRCVENH